MMTRFSLFAFIVLNILAFNTQAENCQSKPTQKAIACLQDRIEALETQLQNKTNSRSSHSVPEQTSSPAKVSAVVQSKEIEFQLLSCDRHRERVLCGLKAKNLGSNADLYIKGNTVIYDEQGNEFFVSSVKIANQSNDLKRGNQNSRTKKKIIKGVLTDLQLVFNYVPVSSRTISTLTIHFNRDKRWKHSVAEFSQIPIQ